MSNRVRIEFLKAGSTIKKFDRLARNKQEAEQLAGEIGTDAKLDYDGVQITFERRVKANLLGDNSQILETFEFKSIDKEGAENHAKKLATERGIAASAINLTWLDPEGRGI